MVSVFSGVNICVCARIVFKGSIERPLIGRIVQPPHPSRAAQAEAAEAMVGVHHELAIGRKRSQVKPLQ